MMVSREERQCVMYNGHPLCMMGPIWATNCQALGIRMDSTASHGLD